MVLDWFAFYVEFLRYFDPLKLQLKVMPLPWFSTSIQIWDPGGSTDPEKSIEFDYLHRFGMQPSSFKLFVFNKFLLFLRAFWVLNALKLDVPSLENQFFLVFLDLLIPLGSLGAYLWQNELKITSICQCEKNLYVCKSRQEIENLKKLS